MFAPKGILIIMVSNRGRDCYHFISLGQTLDTPFTPDIYRAGGLIIPDFDINIDKTKNFFLGP